MMAGLRCDRGGDGCSRGLENRATKVQEQIDPLSTKRHGDCTAASGGLPFLHISKLGYASRAINGRTNDVPCRWVTVSQPCLLACTATA